MESWERDPDAVDIPETEGGSGPAGVASSAPAATGDRTSDGPTATASTALDSPGSEPGSPGASPPSAPPEARGPGSVSAVDGDAQPGLSTTPERSASAPEALFPVGRDDEPVAVDPLPSTGSLRWADDPPSPARPVAGRPAAGSDPAPRPARPVPGPVPAPVDPWGPPTGAPFPASDRASLAADLPAPDREARAPGEAPGSATRTPPSASATDGDPVADPWAPPSGLPFGAAPPSDPDTSARGAHHASGPRPTGGARQRRETIVLAAVGVAVVVVGVAAMALGGGDEDGLPTTTEAPVTTTLALAGDGSDPTGPIVGSTGIVGWWSGSGWLPRSDGVPPEGSVDLTVLELSGATSTARATTVGEECASQRATAEFDLSVDLPGADGGPPPVAVAGVPQPQPRPVEWVPDAGATYQQAAAEVAAGLGAATPPTATATMRGDFDGGGTDEVVVVAEHLADPDAPAAGDWSVVLLRRVVADGVATDVLASSVSGAGGDGFERVRLSGVADLNVDGAMELVVDGEGDDARWTAIHTVGAGGVPAEVLREGCDG